MTPIELIAWLNKASGAIYLATEESVAEEISGGLSDAAALLADLHAQRAGWEESRTAVAILRNDVGELRNLLEQARRWIAGQPERSKCTYHTHLDMIDAIEAVLFPGTTPLEENTPGGSGTAREAPSLEVQPAPQPPIANVSRETPEEIDAP
jgi:hypothetical protein